VPIDPPLAFLLDFDGVLGLAGRAIPGSPEAVAELERRRIPFRVITNTSLSSRATLARRVAERGASIPTENWITALSVSAAWTARNSHGGGLGFTFCGFIQMTMLPQPLSARWNCGGAVE